MPIWRPEISNEEQIANLARVELAKLIATDKPGATIEIVRKFTMPGFAHEVPALDDEEVTLWQMEFGDGIQGHGTLEFGVLVDV